MPFSVLKAIPFSFFSRALYADVVKRWQGIGLRYLIVVILISMIPVTMMREHSLNQMMEESGFSDERELFRYMVDALPTLVIRNGSVQSEPNDPMEVHLPGYLEPLVVIDTTNSQTSLKDTNALMLVNSHQLHMIDPRVGAQTIPMEKVLRTMRVEPGQEMKVTREWLLGFEDQFVRVMKYIAWIYALSDAVGVLVMFVVRALVYAGVAILMAQWMKLSIPFTGLLRVAAVTSTPVLAIQLLEVLSPIEVLAYPRFVYMVVHVAYLHFALDSVRRAVKK